MQPKKTIRICNTCPWIRANQGKRHAESWYSLKNLRRLWNGLRTGQAPGMICHSTDPKNVEYGGNAPVKPGHESECGGAVYLMIRNMNAISDGKSQPICPPLTRSAIARIVDRCLFGNMPSVETELNPCDIGVPWQEKEILP